MATSRFFKSIASATALSLLVPLISWTAPSTLLPAIAEPNRVKTNFRYQPPRRGIPRSTQGTGSRGCPQSMAIGLNLLVPVDHTAETVSGRPTFVWQVAQVPSEAVEFALVEDGVAEPVFVQQVQIQSSGIVQLQLPPSAPELTPGKEYRWSVSLVCNPNRRSSDVFAQGWIQRVAAPAQLKQQLAAIGREDSADALRQRAAIYANAGLWYDAIAMLSTAQDAAPGNSSIREDLTALLDQAGLMQIASHERQRLTLQTLR